MRKQTLILALMLAFPLPGADALVEGFRNPPLSARPSTYYLLLNGYLNRDYVEKELDRYRKAGSAGCVFSIWAHVGRREPCRQLDRNFFLPESVADLAHIFRTAGRLGMEVNFSVSSSWDMGGSWVKPEDGSMTLINSELSVAVHENTMQHCRFRTHRGHTEGRGRRSVLLQDVAVLAIPDPRRRAGWEFVYELPKGRPASWITRALYNNDAPQQHYAKDFTVSVSDRERSGAFRDVVSGTLEAREGAQEFRFPKTRAKLYPAADSERYEACASRVELAEFELYTPDGVNVHACP